MKFKRLLLLLVPLLVLGATACLPTVSLRSESFLDDESLISGEPCEAPCWNGITPGETNWADALAILEATESIDGLELAADEEVGVVQAAWQKAESGQPCCRMIAEGEDQPVLYTFLTLSPNILVDEVLDRYGDPSYLTTFMFEAEAVIQLIYTDVPMVVSVLTGDQDSSLLANSEVVAVLYMTPAEMETIIETNDLLAWDGYQSFSAYEAADPISTAIPSPEASEGDAESSE